MKNQKKIMLAMLTLLIALPTYADDDCQQNWTEACIGNPYGLTASSSAGSTLLILGGLGVATYLFLRADSNDPIRYTRLLNDYKQGRGLRLTSYENELNISLLAINRNNQAVRFDTSASTANFSFNQKKSASINLIQVSTDY